MEKNLTHLNSKIWYRTLKVFFVALFILISGIIIFTLFSQVGSYQSDYLVVCNYGNKNTFLASKDQGIYISTYDDYGESLSNLPDYIREQLKSACNIKDSELKNKAEQIFNGSDDGKKLFNLTATRIATTTYLEATWRSIIFVLIVLVIFEVLRRVFYYIILGSFRPKK